MKKIVFIIDQLYKHGGGEKVLTNKANFIIRNNLAEVFIVTTEQNNNPPCYPLEDRAHLIDLKLNYRRNLSYFNPRNLFKLPFHFLRLKKLISNINPDIVISLSTQFDFYFLPFIVNNQKCTTIKEYHSSRHFYQLERARAIGILKKLLYRINDFVERKYTYLVVLTKDEKKYFKSGNLIVIPNALSYFPSNISSLEHQKVVTIGRLAPVKGYDILIKIWSLVVKNHKDWQLQIFGEGDIEYTDKLKQLIADYGLRNHVHLMGVTDQIHNVLEEASIFVMTSITECFPMVLLEAQANGLPIIAFDCPNGPRNIVTNEGNGILVKQGEWEEFAKAVDLLMNNFNIRQKMGQNALNNVQRYDEDAVMSKWTTLLKIERSDK